MTDCLKCGRAAQRIEWSDPTTCSGCDKRIADCPCPPRRGYPVGEYALPQQDTTAVSQDSATAAAAEAQLAEIAARYAAVDWHDAWKAQPENVDWLIEPLLEAGTVNALFGKPGAGKSLVTLEFALQLARAGRIIVYVDQENRIIDLVERLMAFGAAPDELDRLRMYSFAGLPPLDTAQGGLHLLALAVTAGASLVVIDTTSRMVQGKENDADTFLALYRCSLVPLKGRGITVLRLDHPGKDESRGQRGSSAKDGDVDTIWRLVQAGPATFRLEREKSRSGHGEPIIEMHRRFEPLRHEWTARTGPAQNPVCGQLDTLGVPLNAGRPAARKALDAAGIKVSNAQLEAAIRIRKNCPGQSAGSPGSSASTTDCPPAPRISAGSRAAPAPANPRCGHPECETARVGRCLTDEERTAVRAFDQAGISALRWEDHNTPPEGDRVT